MEYLFQAYSAKLASPVIVDPDMELVAPEESRETMCDCKRRETVSYFLPFLCLIVFLSLLQMRDEL
jgi:hypothetical protein